MEIAKYQNTDAMLHNAHQNDGSRYSWGGAQSLQLEDSACGVQRPGDHQEAAAQHRDPQQPPSDQEGGRHARDCRGDGDPPRPEKDRRQVMVNLQMLNKNSERI